MTTTMNNTTSANETVEINISESMSISSMHTIMSEFNSDKVSCIQAYVNTNSIPVINVSITGLLHELGSYTITYHNADNSDYDREIDITTDTDNNDKYGAPIIVFYDGIAVSNPVQLCSYELLKLLNNSCFDYHEIGWSFTANSTKTNAHANHIIALMKLAFALAGLFKYELSTRVKPGMVNPISIPISMPLLINWTE